MPSHFIKTGNHPSVPQVGKNLRHLIQIVFLIVKNKFMPEEAFKKGVVVVDPINGNHILGTRQDGGRNEAHREKIVKDRIFIVLEVHPLVVIKRINDLFDLFFLLFRSHS